MAAGFSKPITSLKLSDVNELVHVVCIHYVIFKSKAELDQLAEGLRECGVLDFVKKFPKLLEPFFLYGGETLTAGNVVMT